MKWLNLDVNKYSNFLPKKDAAIGKNIAFKSEKKMLLLLIPKVFWNYWTLGWGFRKKTC